MTAEASLEGGGRKLRKKLIEILSAENWPNALSELTNLPRGQIVSPLLGLLLHNDEKIRWRSVIALGEIVNGIARKDMERAREIMRRLMWSLNEESGGIGWGAPETMAEIMVRNERMAEEYSSIFISYLNPKGNYLEYEMLQRGLLWGVARLAEQRIDSIVGASPFIPSYLRSTDAVIRGLAAKAAGLLRITEARNDLEGLLEDSSQIRIYSSDDYIVECEVKGLAAEALALLSENGSLVLPKQ